MGAEKDIIIAVELASTAIRAIAGKREPDGSMQVLAFAQEESSNTIRKGVIDNIDKTTQALTRVVAKLGDKLGVRVKSIYIGLGGQSLRTVYNRVLLQFDGLELLSHKTIDKMRDTNRGVVYPNAEIIEVVPQEFTIGNRSIADPVGMQAESIEANFINIIARPTLEENIRKCVAEAGLEVQEVFISPLCLADALLTANEKRSGCALVDMGADTTTVSVYSKNTLRHLAVIPLGMNNIIKDIASLQMEESDAEKMMLKYGTAYTENNDIDNNMMYSIDSERQVESRKFIEIIEGRLEEIIANVWCQVPEEYCDKLLGGIILTGGGSNMREIEKAFQNYTHIEKIRVAKFVTQTITSQIPEINAHDGKMNTVLGLLAKGDINCCGGELNTTSDLFAPKTPQPETVEQRRARQATETPAGVVRTVDEIRRAEEEAQRKKEEEERIAREKAEEEAREAARIRKENSTWNKMGRWIKDFGKKIVEDEE